MSQLTTKPNQPPTDPGQGPNSEPQDQHHLLLLTIFYYISAGLNLLGLCFGSMYLFMGYAMLSAAANDSANANPDPNAETIAKLFIAISLGTIVLSSLFGLLQLLCAISIQKRHRRTYCLVVAGLTCLSIPIGTALGIYTFIALNRPGIVQRFARTGQLKPG